MATKTIAPTPQRKGASVVDERDEARREEIARRAYEIYLSGQGGSELDDWLRAEAELRESV